MLTAPHAVQRSRRHTPFAQQAVRGSGRLCRARGTRALGAKLSGGRRRHGTHLIHYAGGKQNGRVALQPLRLRLTVALPDRPMRADASLQASRPGPPACWQPPPPRASRPVPSSSSDSRFQQCQYSWMAAKRPGPIHQAAIGTGPRASSSGITPTAQPADTARICPSVPRVIKQVVERHALSPKHALFNLGRLRPLRLKRQKDTSVKVVKWRQPLG